MDSRYLEREMNESVIQSALASGDPAAAELAFREIDIQIQSLADPKERANLLLRKAVLYGVLKRFEDARKEPRLALEQSPNEPDIRLQVDVISGSLYDQEGKPKDAFLRLTEALSLHAEQLKLPEFRFIYEDIQQRRAFDLARMANFQDAIPLFRESLSFGLQPEEHSNLLANLGLCYAELKNYQLARDSFLQACELGLTRGLEGHVHFNLAVADARLNLLREAKSEFLLCEERAAEYELQTQVIYRWLSWVCKGLGENSESEQYRRLVHPC